jgi:glucosylceramidase
MKTHILPTQIKVITTTREQAWQQGICTPGMEESVNLRLTGERHQIWEGWGGCFNELGWIALATLPSDRRDAILHDLFDPVEGCRFNYCRLPIGASDYAAEWYSHNETPGDLEMKDFSIHRDYQHLIPYLKAAMAHRPDMKLFASPWSPPTWMKHPRAYNYGTLLWTPEILRAYALYLAKFVQTYCREGIQIQQIHLQNEPVADQKFPSCVWTGEQMRDFIRDYLGPKFSQLGLNCEIWLGTLNTADYDGFVTTTLSDPEANRFIAGVGLQWDGKGMAQRVHASWPEKRIIQTENECGNGQNTWEYAHYVFGLLQHYITNGAVAYTYWNMVLEPEGKSTWGWKQNAMVTVDAGNQSVTYNPEFHVMKHFSRFIDPGAVRRGVSGCLSGNAVAFENPDGSRVAVVANPLKMKRSCVIADETQCVELALLPESFNTVFLT